MNLKNIDSGSEPNEEQILSLLKTYDPDGYFIMDQSLKDGNDFMTWFTGYDFLDRIGIAVHEEGHRYSHSFPYSTLNGYDAALRNLFYIGNGKTITVKHTDIFNSKEMASGIPEDLRTFRFDTYVGAPRKNLASNVNGVYGLLDEFAAYYYGTKTSVDLYNYYMTLEQTPENWFNYIENVEGQYFAYAEFKYYILKYMLYAKNNHKDIYDGIISNTEFKQAYNIIDQKYVNLINKYFNNKQELIGHLKSLGYNAYENENYFFIGNVGRSVFINDYNKLMEEINKGIYDEIVRDLAL